MFELSNKKGTMHYTPRRELHGTNNEPAATVTFAANCEAGVLALFAPTLRWSFYDKAGDGSDLAEQGSDGAVKLRYPQIENAVKWKGEVIGGVLTIWRGVSGLSDIVLPAKKVDEFKLFPQEGGMVTVEFRVACHPDEGQSGALAMLQDSEVEFTFAPPEATPDLAEQGKR